MYYLLIAILIFLAIFDYIKNKNILTPTFLFNSIWGITLFLYEFKMSYIQNDLSEKTINIFFVCVISFNLTMWILSIIRKRKNKTTKEKKYLGLFKPKFSTQQKLNFFKYLTVILFVIEVIYSRGVPFVWKLMKNGKTYFDFGIPSLNGALYGLIICLGAYSIFNKRKDKYLYIIIGILVLSRQVILSTIIEGIVYAILNKNINLKKGRITIIAIVVFLGFMILGNFRSGNDVMDKVFKPKEQYAYLPDSVKWVYSYMTFSISNFNNLVHITNGGINKGATIINDMLPTILRKKFKINKTFNRNYLVSRNYTVSTYLSSLYLDFDLIGIAIFNVLLALFGFYIFEKTMKYKNSDRYLMFYSIYVHNIVFLFFVNMFIYPPIYIQFIYAMLIFDGGGKVNEQKNKLISIIVPIYNVENYLQECLESILKQTYKNFEVLLVDDGSTDNSANICKLYVEKDKRFKYFFKENGGLSSARNFGISNSKGEFLSFVDSDDIISNDFLETLYNNMINNEVKLSIVGYCNYYNNGTTKNICKSNIKKKISKLDSLMYLNIMGYYSDSACNKMYSREIFDSINFPLNKKYEDTRIMYKIFDKLDYVFYDSDIKYYYRKREGSIVTNQATMFELIDSINDEKLYLNKYPSLEKYINQHLIIAYMSIYNNIDNSKLKFNTHKNAIYLKKQFTYKYLTLSKKIQVFLFINFVSLYSFIYKILKK